MSPSFQDLMSHCLQHALTPSYLDIKNVSHQHNVPADAETHFTIIVVTEQFVGKNLLSRHRLIHEALATLASSAHSISILAKTPKEWEASGGKEHKLPKCRGGYDR